MNQLLKKIKIIKCIAISIALIGNSILATLVFQSCSKGEQSANRLPYCEITAPNNGQEFSKGKSITISVETNDSDGTITEVKYFVDNQYLGSSNDIPHYYNWNTNTESIGTYKISATSYDNSGGSKTDEILIELTKSNDTNTRPVSYFIVTPPNGKTSTNFLFDASGCIDSEDQTSALKVRWDFDGDGIWDSDWETDKVSNYHYNSEDVYNAKLEVKDPEGLTDTFARSITISSSGLLGSFTDSRDGTTYETIDIGNQTWFAENLNYKASNSWYYDNDQNNGKIYGRLYTWQAAMLDACPDGWRIPTKNEWLTLFENLGGNYVAGGKMKEAGTLHWNAPNTGATNISGFNGLPGGIRGGINGLYQLNGNDGFWWSSSQEVGGYAFDIHLSYNSGDVLTGGSDKSNGLSIRCIKE